MKNFLKNISSYLLGNPLAFLLLNLIFNKSQMPYVRAVNYHGTPLQDKTSFERQLIWYKKNFSNRNKDSLINFLKFKEWKTKKPGIIISFDDGLLSNYQMAAKLLEKYQFTGWFMIPAGLINSKSNKSQRSELDTMTWEEVIDLRRRKHEIVCHSMDHNRLSENLTNNELEREVVYSKTVLENRLNVKISSFAWVGGEEHSYSHKAFTKIVNANYSEIFCTTAQKIRKDTNPYFLDRVNVESHFGLYRLRFMLCGLLDIYYLKKRRKLERMLSL